MIFLILLNGIELRIINYVTGIWDLYVQALILDSSIFLRNETKLANLICPIRIFIVFRHFLSDGMRILVKVSVLHLIDFLLQTQAHMSQLWIEWSKGCVNFAVFELFCLQLILNWSHVRSTVSLAVSVAHAIFTWSTRFLEVLVRDDIHVLLTHGYEILIITSNLWITIQFAHPQVNGLNRTEA